MTTRADEFDDIKLVNLVGKFATPLAIFLGCTAAFFSTSESWQIELSLGLLGFTAFFNAIFPRYLKQDDVTGKAWYVKFRLYLNLIANSVVVFFLGKQFPPLWLLLALTPLATAIYASKRRTLANACAASVVLLVIQYCRPDSQWADWGAVAAEIAFIVLISLMINEVANSPVRAG